MLLLGTVGRPSSSNKSSSSMMDFAVFMGTRVFGKVMERLCRICSQIKAILRTFTILGEFKGTYLRRTRCPRKALTGNKSGTNSCLFAIMALTLMDCPCRVRFDATPCAAQGDRAHASPGSTSDLIGQRVHPCSKSNFDWSKQKKRINL